jgi:branched-chain amino acid transport system permease protein
MKRKQSYGSITDSAEQQELETPLAIIQIIVNGLLLGGLYACTAIGFSVIWGVMNLINLAHGSMIVLGAYITFFVSTQTGIDPFLTIPLAGAFLFLVGYLLQTFLINLIVRASVFMTLIFTFGLDMLMINILLVLFTADLRSLPVAYAHETFRVAGLTIPYGRLIVFVLAIALTLALSAFLNRTRTGRAIKATSFDRDAATLSGIDISRIYSVTFAIGAMMAGMAGSLIAVSPVSGESFTMKSFVIVVLGGLGSVPGAILGGMTLGLAENLASYLLDPGYRDAIGFGLLVLTLVLRPEGLLGKRFFAEVKG